jgi:hypothetical protein
MLRWDKCWFHKKRAGTRYIELVFLHPVEAARHVVQFGASGVQNMGTLFVMLVWDWYGFDKSRPGYVTRNMCSCICWIMWVM